MQEDPMNGVKKENSNVENTQSDISKLTIHFFREEVEGLRVTGFSHERIYMQYDEKTHGSHDLPEGIAHRIGRSERDHIGLFLECAKDVRYVIGCSDEYITLESSDGKFHFYGSTVAEVRKGDEILWKNPYNPSQREV